MSAHAFPRVTTRGYYDLVTGKTLKKRTYYLYPAAAFEGIAGSEEIAVVVHGLRNNRVAAVEKFRLCKERLCLLGYRHPVVGFSYDANTRGAHLRRCERQALRAGERIAQKNGRNLAEFVTDFGRRSPGTAVRLMGHSLGSQVIMSTLRHLDRRGAPPVESVHLFGASLSAAALEDGWRVIGEAVRTYVANYHSPQDAVLDDAHKRGLLKRPLGLHGLDRAAHPKFRQVRVAPENHRFASYLQVLDSFP